MIKAADKMKAERKNNIEDILPIDEDGNNVEIIKDQMLDINDKFDYLVSLMMRNNKIVPQSADIKND
jgi:flagellar basal body rod protein FlgB